MKIREAIEYIILENDESIFRDQNRFIEYLNELSSDYPKELKVITHSLNTQILDLFFLSKEKVNRRISKIKWELEDQGLSETWINTILEEFGTPLGWKIPSQNTSLTTTQNTTYQTQISKLQQTKNFQQIQQPEKTQNINNTTYIEVELNANTLRKLGYKDKNAITSIDIPAFFTHKKINYIITKIGNECFLNCSALKSVIIPETVTEIGQASFKNCTFLNNIEIPQNLITIEQEAFAFCYELEDIIIPKKVQSIGINAFKDISNIRYKGNAIGSPWGAVEVNKQTEITLNENVLEILGYNDKNSITEIDIPATFTHKGKDYKIVSIQKDLFKDCTELKKVKIADGISNIDENAFKNCKNLNEIIILDNVITIGDEAFKNCKSIEYVKIPDNAIVCKNAFKGVKNVIYNGSDTGADWGTEILREITLNDNSLKILGYKDKSKITKINIPSTFTHKGKKYKIVSIDKELFKDCEKIKKVKIAEGISNIDENAFENCKNLTEVIIPDSVIKIGDEAFKNCKSLKSVKIPDYAKVGYNAFKGVKNVIYNGYYIGNDWGTSILREDSVLFNPKNININVKKKDDKNNDENNDENVPNIFTILGTIVITILISASWNFFSEINPSVGCIFTCCLIFFILSAISIIIQLFR